LEESALKIRNSNIECPAFAEAPAFRKASGGGASRRQAKPIPNPNIKIQNDFV